MLSCEFGKILQINIFEELFRVNTCLNYYGKCCFVISNLMLGVLNTFTVSFKTLNINNIYTKFFCKKYIFFSVPWFSYFLSKINFKWFLAISSRTWRARVEIMRLKIGCQRVSMGNFDLVHTLSNTSTRVKQNVAHRH